MQFLSPVLKHTDSFVVTGLSTRTNNFDEFNQQTAKLPNLWRKFSSTGLANNENIFGFYSDYESDTNGLYTVTVGIVSDTAQSNSVNIKAGNYLVFQGKGSMPSTVIETWERIWDYFETENEYERNFISDFEAYTSSDEVAIYIGVK